MISRQQLKYIKSLQIKKYRNQAKRFLIEGDKSVLELLHSGFKINTILGTKRFLKDHIDIIRKHRCEVYEADDKMLRQAGSLQSNQSVLAVADMPVLPVFNAEDYTYLVAYDFLQDPGNLGTIIRICDWFNIHAIVLSPDSVDLYNPKVIQASMGSFTRVRVYYKPLEELRADTDLPWIGTSLNGENVHDFKWPVRGIIFFGNESQGLSPGLLSKITGFVSVPAYGKAESLNVSVATGVILDNLKRFHG